MLPEIKIFTQNPEICVHFTVRSSTNTLTYIGGRKADDMPLSGWSMFDVFSEWEAWPLSSDELAEFLSVLVSSKTNRELLT